MANRRTPLEVARISGAARVHAARFRDRLDSKLPPVGPAPGWMDDSQRAAWNLFRAELPWLRKSDSAVLEIAAILRARLTADNLPSVPAMTLLRQCLGQLGASPTDRGRIAPPAEPSDGDVEERHFA